MVVGLQHTTDEVIGNNSQMTHAFRGPVPGKQRRSAYPGLMVRHIIILTHLIVLSHQIMCWKHRKYLTLQKKKNMTSYVPSRPPGSSLFICLSAPLSSSSHGLGPAHPCFYISLTKVKD